MRETDSSVRTAMQQQETRPDKEYYLTPECYKEVFGRPYSRVVLMPRVLIEQGRPVVGMATLTISVDELRYTDDFEVAIPLIVPRVRFSTTNGQREGRFYHFEVPTSASQLSLPYDLGNPYRSVSLENPDIVEWRDGYRYLDYRQARTVTVRDKQTGRGWKELTIQEPSGVVLRWKQTDEEYFVQRPANLHLGLG